jgi:hypothetical protein
MVDISSLRQQAVVLQDSPTRKYYLGTTIIFFLIFF